MGSSLDVCAGASVVSHAAENDYVEGVVCVAVTAAVEAVPAGASAAGGDRQLNSAFHTIAITQLRMSGSRGNRYYRTKIAEGKTPREAARCLIG